MPRRALPTLTLSVALSAALLAGCGGDEETAAPESAPVSSEATTSEEPLAEESTTEEPLADETEADAGAAGRAGVEVPAAEPLPSATPLTPEPGSDAPVLEQISYALEADAVKTARVAKKTSTTCDPAKFDEAKDQQLTCTVDFSGLEIPYTVDYRGGSMAASYTSETTKGVLTREAVLAEMANYGGYAQMDDVRCDVEEMALVDLDEPSGSTCTAYLKVDQETLQTYDVELSSAGISFTRQ